jgi:hypothetical protein
MYNLSRNQVISLLMMFPKNDKLSNMFHVLQKKLINKFTVVISLCLIIYLWMHEIEDALILLCVWHVLQN